MQLKEYQHQAIDELLVQSRKLLRCPGGSKLVLRSPTGSGKTIMTAEFLKQLTTRIQSHLCFIWIAPGKLHDQSYTKLKKHYADSNALRCSYFTDLTDKQIATNEIMFVNWASINRKNKNTIIKENEQEMYLGKILENTKQEGRHIVLIIDESHNAADSEKAKKLISDINPKLTINISATPTLEHPYELVTVSHEDVVAELMIKQSVITNYEFICPAGDDNPPEEFADSTDQLVLDHAIAMRQTLANAFAAEDSPVNPLLLIQLPDRITNHEERIKDWAISYLKSAHGMSTDNGKLAIWLSGKHENKDNLPDNDNEVQVLIFKQAIALGWDCPRAHILLMFRDIKSRIFELQTLGRIMRMPEPNRMANRGAYKNHRLNRGYVYTNLPKVDVQQTIAHGYVHSYTAQRIDEYSPLQLRSVHRLRQREKTRIIAMFRRIFMQAAEEYDLESKIDRGAKTVASSFVSEFETANIDDMVREESEVYGMEINVTHPDDVQRLFDYFVMQNLSPYYPEQHSVGMVKDALYQFFGGPLVMENAEDAAEIPNIILSKKNNEHFVNVLTAAKTKYQEETEKRDLELVTTQPWEVCEHDTYNENYKLHRMKKSMMQPFYKYIRQSQPETKFIEYLEQHNEVKWWYQNGVRESKYFAVEYTDNSEQNPFYVDFIVQLVGGRIGLFDTKGGIIIDAAKEKSDGLLDYIKKENQTRKGAKLFGGIVTNDDGSWKIYQGKGKHLTQDDLTNWEQLDFAE